MAVIGTFRDYNQVSLTLEALNEHRSSSKFCDVILQISNEKIYAHSNVLASASPYFDALFSGQDLPRAFSQKTPQIIEIHIDGPADPGYINAVHKVVDFMYTTSIQIDDSILIQVLEIARIMQMASIIEFCNLFNQGCLSYNIGQPITTKETCESASQTSDGTVRNTEKIVIYNEEGKDDKWVFQRNLQRKPVLFNNSGGFKRKRGRPRKKPQDDSSCDKKVDSTECAGENGNVVDTNNENEEQIKENSNSEKENDNIDVNVVPQDQTSSEPSLRTPVRKSKHGRIIKPKKFSDDMVQYLKDEPLSDNEIEDSENVSKSNQENGTVEKFLNNDTDYKVMKKFSCDLCDYATQNMKELNEHHRDHLHSEKKCSYCGWVCENPDVTNEEFMEHVNNHKGSTFYFCTFCPQRFNTKAKLYQHLPKHSKTKPYCCDICGTGFKWKHALKAHMTVHKDSKDYLCDICGFATAHKTQLKAHHLIHTGNTFKCPQPDCEYQSTKRSNLKFHMMTHSREKPHQCELCGQSFSLVKNMKRHMLLHANDRPFRCDYCSFSTTRFDKLKEHYFKQHKIGEKPKKKFRLTEYMKMQEMVDNLETEQLTGEQIETEVLNIPVGENMETIELQVPADTNGLATTQIVNVTSSNGENIPIAITQNGREISYEIPVHLISQEVVQEVTTD